MIPVYLQKMADTTVRRPLPRNLMIYAGTSTVLNLVLLAYLLILQQ